MECEESGSHIQTHIKSQIFIFYLATFMVLKYNICSSISKASDSRQSSADTVRDWRMQCPCTPLPLSSCAKPPSIFPFLLQGLWHLFCPVTVTEYLCSQLQVDSFNNLKPGSSTYRLQNPSSAGGLGVKEVGPISVASAARGVIS